MNRVAPTPVSAGALWFVAYIKVSEGMLCSTRQSVCDSKRGKCNCLDLISRMVYSEVTPNSMKPPEDRHCIDIPLRSVGYLNP